MGELAVDANLQRRHSFYATLVCFIVSLCIFCHIHSVSEFNLFACSLQFCPLWVTTIRLMVITIPTQYGVLIRGRQTVREKHAPFILVHSTDLSILFSLFLPFAQLVIDRLGQCGLLSFYLFIYFLSFKVWEFPSSCYIPKTNQLQHFYQT